VGGIFPSLFKLSFTLPDFPLLILVIQQSIVQITKAHPKNLPMVLDTCVALLVNPSPSSLSTTLFSSHSASSKAETTRLASARCLSQLPISQADLSVHIPLISKYVSTETNPTLLVPLSMALLRAKQSTKCLTSSERTEVTTTVQLAVSSLLKQNLFWPVFLIAREALTRSFHSISSLAFAALSEKVESEAFYFWLSALKTFSEAEDVTCSSNLLPDVLVLLYKGLTHLKGAITTKTPFSFQHSWIELRIAFFEKLMTLKSAAAELSAFQLHPEDPPEHTRNIALQAKVSPLTLSYRNPSLLFLLFRVLFSSYTSFSLFGCFS
jgi:hypothetical protein